MQVFDTQDGSVPGPGTNAGTVNLIDYLEVIAKHRRMIVRMTLAAFVTAIIASLLMAKKYSSTAMIVPPQQDNGLMGLMMKQVSGGGGVASLAGDLLGKGSPADFYASVLKCEAIEDKVIDRFDLIKEYGQDNRLDTYKKIDKTVTIEVGKKDGIISVSVLDKDPKKAADMANYFVDELGKLAAQLSVTDAAQDRAFAENRLAQAKADLARSEEAIRVFQSQNKAIDIVEQAKGTIKGVADLEGQLAVEEVKLAGMLRVLTESSQDVKNERAVIANIRSQISKFEGIRVGSAVPGVGSVPALGQNYVRLLREFKTQEALVELLTKQYEMSKFTEAKDLSSIQIIQRAKAADKKIKPQRSLLVLAATLVTFVFAVIVAFLLDLAERMPPEQRERWIAFRKNLLSV